MHSFPESILRCCLQVKLRDRSHEMHLYAFSRSARDSKARTQFFLMTTVQLISFWNLSKFFSNQQLIFCCTLQNVEEVDDQWLDPQHSYRCKIPPSSLLSLTTSKLSWTVLLLLISLWTLKITYYISNKKFRSRGPLMCAYKQNSEVSSEMMYPDYQKYFLNDGLFFISKSRLYKHGQDNFLIHSKFVSSVFDKLYFVAEI